MWTLNTDTGKWSNQTDNLSYDVYTNLKQDLQSLRLFSKCLSGSTYLPINKLTDIYDVLNYEKVGFWSTTPPTSGPTIMPTVVDNNTISDEFYNKYLKENAFTLKNLFTPNKLINDQLTNYVYVDVATTTALTSVTSVQVGLMIDDILLKEGHRVLVKDQRTEVTIPSLTDPNIYFGSTNYHLLDTFGTEATYYYFNNQNGIYKYTNNKLVKESDLDTYDGAYRYSVAVKLGSTNRDTQFHLIRGTDGYYPQAGSNMEFQPKHNWVLRNRVDYHNIYDNSYYDILHHESQTYVVSIPGTVSTTYMTYSIPARTVAVGDFGVIINNQDKLNVGSTFSVSLIIDNKYKSNIRSIAEVDGFYWCCGDSGTLLKVSKIDFSIKPYELNETSQLTSISFFNGLYGMVVGKYNTIYYTFDGGDSWKKLTFPEFDIYSYNKVVQYSINQSYIGGETGLFIEMNYSTSGWIAYKRKITKQLTTYDQYDLVDDINDMSPLSWTTIPTYNYTQDSTSVDFANSLKYTSKIIDGNNLLQISVNSPYFGNTTFSSSSFFIGFRITDVTTSTYVYTSPNFGVVLPTLPTYNTWDIWQYGVVSSNLTFTQSLPIDIYGVLENSSYLVEANIIYNWDGLFGTVSIGYEQPFDPTSWNLNSVKSRQLIIVTNQDNIITYDIDNVISPISNQFVYLTFSQSHSDIQTVTTNKYDVYICGDKLYKFNFTEFTNIGNTATNIASGTSSLVSDLYVNKLYSTINNLYLAGNYGLLDKWDYSTSFDKIDPDFDSRIQSKLLFLDYDIASKLNFFDNDGQYVLPSVATFSYGLTSLSVSHLPNEKNWLDYYKDSEKTFRYYSSIDDSDSIQFSSNFVKVSPSQYSSWTFSSSNLTISHVDIAPYAPNINSSTASRFISGSVGLSTVDPIPTGLKRVYAYKYLVMFVMSNSCDVSEGDVLNFSSNIINCNLVVNRVNISSIPSPIPFGYTGQKKIIYCYSDFNQNIINGLNSGVTTVTNLNRFSSYTDLITNFNNHRIGIGYKLTDDGLVSLSARFNNKTAYYNMQSLVNTSSMVYSDHFLKFGYSPTYNILDYLYNIDPIFISSKVLTILPQYYSLSGGSLTDDTVWIDTGISTNKIYFGINLKNKWESLLINTFVDINCDSYSTERLLIINKSYDTKYGAYYIDLHKKVNTGNTSVASFDIISRNTLGQISDDLQLLNNIQRTSTVRTIQYAHTITNLENELKSKFFTDSYMKALVSDYDVRNKLSAIIYIDSDNQLAMNVIHVEKEFVYDITSISDDGLGNTLLNLSSIHELKVADGIVISGTNSFSGYTTIISNPGLNQVVVSKPYSSTSYGLGQITFIKKDPFFNFQPIDLFNYGSDQEITRSVEVKPENFELTTTGYQITGLDLTNYKMQFVDGLSLTEVNNNYPWLLEAEISNAIIGRDSNGPIWYSGTWLCGRWFGGTWISGKWVSGDWYSGTWSAFNNTYNIISVKVDTSYVDDTVSKWYNGRWFDGTWKGGTWYNGRRYAGDWQRGNWYNGIWNDGHWINGSFGGGIWVRGTWDAGTFNCVSKPSYWLDGSFKSGDFENGMWYNGQFGNMNNLLSRFGTKSTNTRNSTWQGGKWLNGEFHSYLNTDDNDNPTVSDIHKFSIWKTGTWYSGSWYGGIAYNIDFKSGTWYGGILEEIQVVGVGSILPAVSSSNSIFVNGDFMFNIGDEVWVIDDYNNGAFSPLGNNDNPMMYRVNKIVEYPSTDPVYPNQTQLYLNYNLSSLGVSSPYSGLTYSNLDMHLRLVSHFKEAKWYGGIWTNGIFDGGTFYSGIWYNGVFNGTWGV
jgi:hypothetical protein